MAAQLDITGKRFGKLVALTRETPNRQPSRWIFQCDCGLRKSIRRSHVVAGAVNSCGCIVRSRDGWSQSRVMHIWRGMMSRCHKPTDHRWERYGGRGIHVCREWHDFNAFRVWAEANGYLADLEIDRIDNEKGYSPQNCRFVTRAENVRNRGITRVVQVGGSTMPLAAAAEEAGIKYATLRSRLNRGETGEHVLRATSLRSFFGKPMTFKEAAEEFGIKERTIRYRLKKGLSPEESVSRPISRGRGYNYDWSASVQSAKR